MGKLLLLQKLTDVRPADVLACVQGDCKAGAKIVDLAQKGDDLIEELAPII